MTLLILFVTCSLGLIVLIASLNALTFPRLERYRHRPLGPHGTVSVLIPARDEAARIGATLSSLLAQEYPDFELLVLDDNSSDGTAQVVRSTAKGDPRLRLLQGAELPPGWLGKNWACAQLAAAARGEILLFSDADVIWSPEALAAVMHYLQASRADMATVWPTQETCTWAERLIVPLMSLAIIGYLPVLAVHHIPFASLAAANGQCLAFRREAYRLLGGHEGVKASVVEDITLARRAKKIGLRLRAADGDGLVSCRMYASWSAVRDGYAKNVLAGHGSLFLLALSTVFHWLIYLFPWLWLAIGWLAPGYGWPAVPLALIALGVGVRSLAAAVTRQRLADSLLLPVSAVLMTVIVGRAVWWQCRYGAAQWKGRWLKV
ncbi:MAG: glycosyltransferase [Anaerolineales bacterium]|nr:glycosyltransferase [Anaerolineales bacterium]